MFSSLLIANRGEIACRIIRTAKRLGIATIAVYSDVDRTAQHVRQADRAIYIGPAAPEQSYLNGDAIIRAAKETQAQAIHPGYGFLSENPLLAQRCEQEGIVFIGPSAQILQLMGSKQQAKACLEGTTVPLIPGYHGADQSYHTLLEAARIIGLPLLIKAAAGGGGKGMRIITDFTELKEQISAAQREAQNYFGDPTLILEKLIEDARHIEVQIIGDQFGQVMSLCDRECSIQRRHQKIIEEAPAPNLKEATRLGLYQAARTVGELIQYVNAGTIEFLVDSQQRFYFMEMNTRLQVEHPVTEAITAIDLVEWQIRVANQERLPAGFSTLTPYGHAIECRIYAEDPAHAFLPSTGQLMILSTPAGDGIRLDSGYDHGDPVTPFYDPLIAKLITHGKNREHALRLMQHALKNYCIAGVTTNVSFLFHLCHHPSFIQGQVSTNFLNHQLIPTQSAEPPLAVIGLVLAYDYDQHLPTEPLHRDCFAWHPFLARSWQRQFCVQTEHELLTLTAEITAQGLTEFLSTVVVSSGDLTPRHITIRKSPERSINQHDHQNQKQDITIELNGQQYFGRVLYHQDHWICFHEGERYHFYPQQGSTSHQTSTARAHTAPMPGTVVAVLKQAGDHIQPNEGIMIIEAMKMEHTVCASHAGTIEAIYFQSGDQVSEGIELFLLKDTHATKNSDSR